LRAAALGILLVGAEHVFLTVLIGAVAAGLIILIGRKREAPETA